MFADVTADDVRRAAVRLREVAVKTPLRRAPRISARVGGDVWLKLENEQLTGSFKLRGAFNALVSLSADARARGVVTASAGNHGRGLALAAQRFGVPVMIFVPRTVPRVKLEGMRECNATIDTEAAHYDEAHARAIAFGEERGLTYVDPCVGAPLVAGQGTVALEIVEQLPGVRTVITPVGGAGLLGGIGAFLRDVKPNVRIVGAQSANTNAMAASLAAGRVTDTPIRPTLADGLAGAIDEHALDVGRHALDEMVTVDEADIARAMVILAEEEDVIAEGAGAVGVAALLANAIATRPDPVVVVISGGNVDVEVLEKLRLSR